MFLWTASLWLYLACHLPAGSLDYQHLNSTNQQSVWNVDQKCIITSDAVMFSEFELLAFAYLWTQKKSKLSIWYSKTGLSTTQGYISFAQNWNDLRTKELGYWIGLLTRDFHASAADTFPLHLRTQNPRSHSEWITQNIVRSHDYFWWVSAGEIERSYDQVLRGANLIVNRSGKSSITSVVFHKMEPQETLFLESTTRIQKDTMK